MHLQVVLLLVNLSVEADLLSSGAFKYVSMSAGQAVPQNLLL